MPTNEEWLSIEDIYNQLGGKVKRDTIRSWIRNGRLTAYRPGRVYLVKQEDLDNFLKESRITPNTKPQ
ncbi:MAG TPA: excisionase family DNA-binding protein [Ktedonobacteraceae bacterium]|nr:excisionase family DNA-binding protein [Ktedonobacteraceae bacterium]